jgi:hypothetical protein
MTAKLLACLIDCIYLFSRCFLLSLLCNVTIKLHGVRVDVVVTIVCSSCYMFQSKVLVKKLASLVYKSSNLWTNRWRHSGDTIDKRKKTHSFLFSSFFKSARAAAQP